MGLNEDSIGNPLRFPSGFFQFPQGSHRESMGIPYGFQREDMQPKSEQIPKDFYWDSIWIPQGYCKVSIMLYRVHVFHKDSLRLPSRFHIDPRKIHKESRGILIRIDMDSKRVV